MVNILSNGLKRLNPLLLINIKNGLVDHVIFPAIVESTTIIHRRVPKIPRNAPLSLFIVTRHINQVRLSAAASALSPRRQRGSPRPIWQTLDNSESNLNSPEARQHLTSFSSSSPSPTSSVVSCRQLLIPSRDLLTQSPPGPCASLLLV